MATAALELRTAFLFVLVLSLALVLVVLPLDVFALLACLPCTASMFIGASPINVGWLGCHDRLAPQQLSTVCLIMAESGREPQVSNGCVRRNSLQQNGALDLYTQQLNEAFYTLSDDQWHHLALNQDRIA